MQKGKFRLIILISLFVVVTVIVTIIFWPMIVKLGNPEYREAFGIWVKGLGAAGVFILLGIQILQIVVAVIPGGPVQLIAGAAYGPFGGLAIIAGGCALTSTLIFFTVRKLGLPLLRRFFGEKDLNTWMFLKDSRKTARVVFILFLIPGTPKDLLTWLCPLTKLTLPMFVVLSTLARIPAMFSSTVMGSSIIGGNWKLTLAVFSVTAVIGFLGMWFKDKITDKISHKET
ncbi:MAG: VTT domain-containing protein [Treponema sp.]|nr:VTT domain-containing protein [Treponema sp.]